MTKSGLVRWNKRKLKHRRATTRIRGKRTLAEILTEGRT